MSDGVAGKAKAPSAGKARTRTETLQPSALRQLNFYQLKAGTSQFFHQRLGRTNVTIEDTPHFALASALAGTNRSALSKAKAFYKAYLVASWGCAESDPRIDERVAKFNDSFAFYKASGFAEKPVLTKLPTSDQAYVVDGNHRTSMAAALDKPLQVEVWPTDMAFLKFNRVKEFYGTDNKNMPYQSLYLNGQEVIPGRRRDLLDRLSMIPKEAIVGKDVLDVACNVGMSSLLAKSLGARSCLGLEYSPAMVDIATRFAMFSDAYPAVSFRQFNVDTDVLPEDQVFNTAFMFSIHDHLKQPLKLIDVAARNVRRFVIFEGHPSGRQKKYAAFFESGLFSSVSEIGRLHASRSKQDSSRILWLCEKPSAAAT